MKNTIKSTYCAGVGPERDINISIMKRNIIKTARPTQKAITMESVRRDQN